MKSARYRSHLSWILILQIIFSIVLSTWHVTISDASTTTPPLAFPGQYCNGLYNDSCVANAFCNNNSICQCNDTFYSFNHTCVSKYSLNQNCSGNGTCVDVNAECNVTCQCKNNYYNNNDTCWPKYSLNQMCNGTETCVDPNAKCNVTCQCKSNYYNNSGTCWPKVLLYQWCNETEACLDSNAECYTTCQCKSGFFASNSICDKQYFLNQNCSGNGTCVDVNAECNVTCQCKNNFYNNNGTCWPKVALNGNCSGSKPCMDQHAECNGTCQCKSDYYNNNGTCSVRLRPADVCNSTNQCVPYTNCSYGRCVCWDTHYTDSQQGVCRQRLRPADECNSTNQCVPYANCSNRTCACWDTHYTDSQQGVCRQRLRPADLCNSTNQCVSFSNCSYGKCACWDTHYTDSQQGICRQRHRPADVCNSTDQCVAYANCSYGKCVCWDTHYTDSQQGVCRQNAENLVNLTVEEPLTVGQLNVKWTPGGETGNTSYNVTWFEETSIGSEQFSYKGSWILHGYMQNAYTITGLLSYWNYRVSVRPSTEKGVSPEEKYTVARTLDSAPGEVEIFTINQPSDSAQYLHFTVSCPKEKQRNGLITSFVFRSSIPVNETLGSVSATKGCNENYIFNASVKAETNYTFEALASTNKHEGIYKRSKYFVAPRAPKLGSNSTLGFGESLLKDPTPGGVTKTTAVFSICPCLVTDHSQGKITLAGLIVCNTGKGDCETSANFRSDVMTWKQFMENDYKGSYRPTPDDWHKTQHVGSSRRKRSTSISRSIREIVNEIKFTLGDDVSCEQHPRSVYCNGPLPPDSTLVVKVFACTAGGCKEADSGITFSTLPEDGPNVGDIVGGVLGALAAILIIVVIIAFMIRRHKQPTVRAQRYMQSITKLRRSTKLKDFNTRLEILHRDSNLRFQEEFEELCSSQGRQALEFTMHAGNKPVNRVKNRSQDVLPYDHSRVVLINNKNSVQDYINASYIAGGDSPCEYIATQGPLYSTLSDFWRMVYEHRTGVIVMLCDSVENGKKMVDPYWPDEINVPVRHGDLTVIMTGVSVLDAYAVRKMTVTMRERQDIIVTQLCIRGWSELGCSLPVEKLIDVIRVVGREATKSSGPVTVHCNLGVGRTGMFIALDHLARFVDNHALNHEVNVYDVVQRMMGCRPNIIQTLDQYMFVHDVLGVIIKKKMQNGHRGATPSVVYENHGHTINVYNELYKHNENLYSALNERQMK